ncbi:MAG: hypothetical protein LC808_03930, partial [Actinobacteria bacterium]|nr:hypothetical protein [Actinomycetota bacterium]
GIGGIWEQIKEKVGDLKENLFSKISEYLIPTVLIAGITWIISLLNPASAFIKACKMIIDIVTFIVERGAQIIQFVNAVLDAVIAIAGGGAGGVPALIENALALSVPVLIGALAAILGIGGIADKVKKFFQSLSKPVMKAVDWVVGKIVAFGKKIWAKLKAKTAKLRDKARGGDDTPAGKQKRLSQAMATAVSAVNRFQGNAVSRLALRPILGAIKLRYGLTSLELVQNGQQWAVSGELNPKSLKDTNKKVGSDWNPEKPSGEKPGFGEPGAAEWRYKRYLWTMHKTGKKREDCLSFNDWRRTHYTAASSGGRPGRRGGAEQVATKEHLTKTEGVREVETVELGGHYPDGIGNKPNSKGGQSYYEVGKMLKRGAPEARERKKLQKEIDALGSNDTITFVDKTNPANRIIYKRGDSVE